MISKFNSKRTEIVFEKFKKDTYDLCILDVMMPLQGYYTYWEIRK
jgi:DNA-binding response OmpR family regulator